MKKINELMLGASLLAGCLLAGEALAQCCPGHAAAPRETKVTVATEAKAVGEVKYITKETLQEMIKANEDLLIVDVLDAASFAKHHVAGAVHIPLGRIEAELKGFFAEVPKDRPIVVYCANRRCKASTKAAQVLMAAGFTNVVDYENGIAEWAKAGLPVGTGEACAPCGNVKGQPGCCAKAKVCPATGAAPTCDKAKGCPLGAAPTCDKAKGCPLGAAKK